MAHFGRPTHELPGGNMYRSAMWAKRPRPSHMLYANPMTEPSRQVRRAYLRAQGW